MNYLDRWRKILNEEKENKILYILRGISGSGKTTKAKTLTDNPNKIFSTDDYFMKNGEYQFNPQEIGKAHEWNEKRVEDAMTKKITPIVVDNTVTQKWEARRYVELARQYGYEVKFEESEASWRFDPEELAKRNIHKVPLDTIKKMLARYEPHDSFTIDNVLNSKKPWEK